MISANQFRSGMTVRFEGEICQVVEYQHVKPGKGGAFVRVKLRNVTTGAISDKTLRPENKYEQLRTESRAMTYLYDEPDQVVFMDAESYEQLGLPTSGFEGKLDFMKVNMEVNILYIDGEPFGVELPTFVDFEVTETDPAVKGDTVSNVMKAAIIETGATIQVPLFVEAGDVIRIDTRTREYNTRV